MDIISTLAPHFERYITLERVHPKATYDYRARNMFAFPVFESTLHGPKCNGGSWMYVAVRGDADLAKLADSERLYVGSQTEDRMFRGDGMSGKNFHHAQMRTGNGLDTPEAYLQKGRRIDIYKLDARRLAHDIDGIASLVAWKSVVTQAAKHPGFWLEQFVLVMQSGRWRWNTSGATAEARKLVRQVGMGS